MTHVQYECGLNMIVYVYTFYFEEVEQGCYSTMSGQ